MKYLLPIALLIFSASMAMAAPGDVTYALEVDGSGNVAQSANFAGTYFKRLGTSVAVDTDARFPTADEKAALSGTSGSPSTSNKFVTDGDPRNTNARMSTGYFSDTNQFIYNLGQVSAQSAGLMEYVAPTDNHDGTITVPAQRAAFYNNSEFSGRTYVMTVPAYSNLALTNGVTNYVVASWDGVPGHAAAFSVTFTLSDINVSNVVPYATVFRDAGVFSVVSWDSPGSGLGNKIFNRLAKTDRFKRESGLALGEAATRLISIAEGVTWNGINRETTLAYNSGTDSLQLWYHAGASWAVDTSRTQYDNTRYDTGAALATLSGGRYAVNWVYRCEDPSTKVAMIVLGGGDYRLNQAQASQPPGTLPPSIASNTVLVGRIIVQKGDAAATQIDSAFSVAFTPSGVYNHEDLSGLSGALPHNHLSAAELTSVQALQSASTRPDTYFVPSTRKVNGQELTSDITITAGLSPDSFNAGAGLGILTSADSVTYYATGGGGSVTSVTATAPLASSGGATPDIAYVPDATHRMVTDVDTAAWNAKVDGPSASTDSEFAVFSGTGGKTLKRSNLSSSSFLAPTGSAANLTNFPTLNQNTTGTASNVTGVVAVANGGTASTTAASARDSLGVPIHPNGWEPAAVVALTYVDSKFTLTPTGTAYYWIDGTRQSISALVTTTAHANTTGTWYCYYSTASPTTLVVANSVWDIMTTTQCAYVYYNAATGASQLFNELHGDGMSNATHKYEHLTTGGRLISGGMITEYTLATNTDSARSFSMGNSLIADEDMYVPITGVAKAGPYRIWYRTGTDASNGWTWTASAGQVLPYFKDAGNDLYWNRNNAGTWQQTLSATNGNRVNYWVCAVPAVDTSYQTIIIQGQSVKTSLALAQAENIATNISWGTMPFAELVPLYQITYARSGGNWTIEAVTRISNQTTATLSGASPSVHNALSGRDAISAHPQASIDGLLTTDTATFQDLVVTNGIQQTQVRSLAADLSGKQATLSSGGTGTALLTGAKIKSVNAGANVTVTDAADSIRIDVGASGHVIKNGTTTLATQPALNFSSTQFTVADGTGETTVALNTTATDTDKVFTSDDLAAGVLSFTHGLNEANVSIALWDATGSGVGNPDSFRSDGANAVKADFSSFLATQTPPLTASTSWKMRVSKAGIAVGGTASSGGMWTLVERWTAVGSQTSHAFTGLSSDRYKITGRIKMTTGGDLSVRANTDNNTSNYTFGQNLWIGGSYSGYNNNYGSDGFNIGWCDSTDAILTIDATIEAKTGLTRSSVSHLNWVTSTGVYAIMIRNSVWKNANDPITTLTMLAAMADGSYIELWKLAQ